jgi:tyrosine-protein phosphatase SIW14
MPKRFSEVVPGLFRGGKPSPKELGMLKDLWGVKRIISLDDESGKEIQPVCARLGLEHIIWGITDGHDPKIAAIKKRIIPNLLHEPTYVHCYHGRERTGMVIAMFRVYHGWPVHKALEEAHMFGMKKGQGYYKAVNQYARELDGDRNNSMDAVSLMREQNSFAPTTPGNEDSTRPRGEEHSSLPPHADIEFSQLSRIARARIYCKCNPSRIMQPKVFWWGSAEAAEANPTDADGKLFSAGLTSDTKIERFDGRISKSLIHNILTREIDVAVLHDNQFLVLYPGALVDVQEDNEDVSDMFMPQVGTRDNSTDYTFVYPGSGSGVGGMPDGAAGVVQLPYSGPGQV